MRREHEAHLRAQLLTDLNDPEITLRGLSSRTGEDDATASTLEAHLLIDGTPRPHLDALVTRLSLEAGVRTISWSDIDPTHCTTTGDDHRTLGRDHD